MLLIWIHFGFLDSRDSWVLDSQVTGTLIWHCFSLQHCHVCVQPLDLCWMLGRQMAAPRHLISMSGEGNGSGTLPGWVQELGLNGTLCLGATGFPEWFSTASSQPSWLPGHGTWPQLLNHSPEFPEESIHLGCLCLSRSWLGLGGRGGYCFLPSGVTLEEPHSFHL